MTRAPRTRYAPTEGMVDRLTPRAAPFDAYFTNPRGFCVRVFPDGRLSFGLRYKSREGYHRITIGDYGPWTVRRALAKANELREKVDDDQVPSPHEARRVVVLTVAQLADDYHGALERAAADKSLSVTHVRKVQRALRTLIPKKLAVKLITAVAVDDIARVLDTYHDRPARYNDVRSSLSGLFAYALRRELLTRNPVAAIRPKSLTPREPDPLNATQCFALGKALRDHESAGKPWQAAAAVRLLFLTACRRSEILNLTWSEVMWDLGQLHLSKSKTLRRTGRRSDRRTIGAPVLQLLRDIQARHEREKIDSPYVLPSPVDPSKPYRAIQRHWEEIRTAAGVPAMHLHDFRHDVLSDFGAEYTSAIGQAVSGHTTLQHLARYQKAQKDDKVAAAANSVTERRMAALNAPAIKLVG
jgi:integrase